MVHPAQVWASHGTEIILVALAVLILRPLIGGTGVALLHNTILPNFGTMMRWRAHRHVLRQPVGWFESDFAGRIANRIMQAPPAAGEAVFQTFDAVAFASTTLVGAAIMLAGADVRLLLPLVLWFAGYVALMRWTIGRAGPAATASSDARSAVTGRVVDAYANIHSVKLFAHHDLEESYGREAIERARQTFFTEMRVVTKMDIILTALNGLLIVAVTAWAMWLWYHKPCERWHRGGGGDFGAAAEQHDLLDHVGDDQSGAKSRHRAGGDADHHPADCFGRSTGGGGVAVPAGACAD